MILGTTGSPQVCLDSRVSCTGIHAHVVSSARLNLGASFLVLKQGLRYELNVYHMNVFYVEPNFAERSWAPLARPRSAKVDT